MWYHPWSSYFWLLQNIIISIKCLPLTISYHLYFLRICQVKWCYFTLTYYFLACFCLFFIKKVMFLSFLFFFLVPNFCNRVLINQKMELVIRNCQCDKWPKLYDKWPFVTCTLLLTHSNIPKIYQLTRWRYTFIFESLASKNKAKFIFRLTMNFRDFLFLNHSFKGHAWACFLV